MLFNCFERFGCLKKKNLRKVRMFRVHLTKYLQRHYVIIYVLVLCKESGQIFRIFSTQSKFGITSSNRISSVNFCCRLVRAMLYILVLCVCVGGAYSMPPSFKTCLGMKELYWCQTVPFMGKWAKNFTHLMQISDLFSDKSRLIKEILQNPNKVILLTRPYRWGKTINIYMMKTFLEIRVDDLGNRLPINLTSNYRLFVKGQVTYRDGQMKNLKCPLYIKKYPRVVDEYLGRVPVIFVNFAGITGKNFIELMDEMKDKIRETFLEHSYIGNLLNKTIYNEKNKDIRAQVVKSLNMFDIIRYKRRISAFTTDVLQKSLHFLSELLHQQFNKTVYILMDEYDTPWTKMYLSNDFKETERKEFWDFYTAFMTTTFKTNSHMERAIITGVLPLPMEQREHFSEVAEYTVLSGEYMEFYGFNQWEVDGIFHYRHMKPLKHVII